MTQIINHMLHVLIVEDESRYRAFLIEVLREMGCDPMGAATAEQATGLMAARPPDILVLDLNLPVVDGMTFLEQFRKEHPEVPVIIMTGFGDLRAAPRAIQLGVTEFLTKPCHLGQIEQAIDRARRQLSRNRAAATDLRAREEPANRNDDDRSLASIERAAILEALQVNRGNRSAVAARLGISRRALYNKIEEYRRDGHTVP